jgi:hypothetical protein
LGDLRYIRGTVLTLDACDATTQWSCNTEDGVQISAYAGGGIEGTGCLVVYIPAGKTALVKCTKASGSWDLQAYKYLRLYAMEGAMWTFAGCYKYFGESAYDEQTSASFMIGGSWALYTWDISLIAAASRNAVTIFSLSIPNTSGAAKYVYIDDVYADPGPAQLKGHDGDRVILLYPKIYHGTYTGDGVDDKIITIPRKGVPTYIEIQRDHATNSQCVYWQVNFGAGNCLLKSAGGAFLTGYIKTVGDCYFTLGTNADINTNEHPYYFTVMWED